MKCMHGPSSHSGQRASSKRSASLARFSRQCGSQRTLATPHDAGLLHMCWPNRLQHIHQSLPVCENGHRLSSVQGD